MNYRRTFYNLLIMISVLHANEYIPNNGIR